ncbi:hypothetical protein [Kibdelosporangium aridum]|uniref:hypothetical protein n=1 Tax=Kibdelosporangium aridum TaxID=2030 RepID=UPI0009FE7BE4|nr:hypothetical protein [Kibdelosporangium aridum]
MRTKICWVAAVLVVASACGAGGQPPQQQPSPTVTSTPSSPSTEPTTGPSTSVPSVTLPPITRPSTKPTGGGGEVVVEGVVVAGVEASCVLLETGADNYLLLGADPQIAVPGRRITVRGKVEPGMATFCMQGTPLAVSEAKPAQ